VKHFSTQLFFIRTSPIQLNGKMTQRKTAYELSESQVSTPAEVVSLFWRLMDKRRRRLGNVLDVGAGDCRFAQNGNYSHYTGVEIDKSRCLSVDLPKNAELIYDCAFKFSGRDYDACIGNPPYVRHHDIENPWKQETVERLERALGVKLDKHCNLYLYFLCLGLLKTRPDGLVSFVIPYEWVSRPSAKAVRDHIHRERWAVDVYRFQKPIFDGVLTTASVSIVDKRSRSGRWRFFDITPESTIVPRKGIADAKAGVLKYEDRGGIWALRGLSPGSQSIFTLTEGERIHHGLRMNDVVPCVTTLKHVPYDLKILNRSTFRKHFVETGARCWLIKSYGRRRSATLDAYLESIPKTKRDNYTCSHQNPWFNYVPHPSPQILVSTGFTKFGPKVLLNSLSARAVGSVLGIHSKYQLPTRRIQKHLLNINFEERLVAHAKTLKKIEVKQMNSVLRAFSKRLKLNDDQPVR
jgi:hypothetical protein